MQNFQNFGGGAFGGGMGGNFTGMGNVEAVGDEEDDSDDEMPSLVRGPASLPPWQSCRSCCPAAPLISHSCRADMPLSAPFLTTGAGEGGGKGRGKVSAGPCGEQRGK